MATTSEVKSGMQAIADTISGAIGLRARAKSELRAARMQLMSLPTVHADVITTIDGYTPSGAFETQAKDEKARMASEFVALRTAIEGELTALGEVF